MWKPLSMAFFVVCVAWFISIFASTDPQVRMDRTCLPVEYSGRVGTSSMMLIKADWAPPTHEFFEGITYGCKFVLWRMFYEESWNSAQPSPQPFDQTPAVASNSASQRSQAGNSGGNDTPSRALPSNQTPTHK